MPRRPVIVRLSDAALQYQPPGELTAVIEDRLQETLAGLAADRERRASEPWTPSVEMPIPPPMRLDIHICPTCRRKDLTGITVEQPEGLRIGRDAWKSVAPRSWTAEPCGCYIDQGRWQAWSYLVGEAVFREWQPLDPRTGQPLAA